MPNERYNPLVPSIPFGDPRTTNREIVNQFRTNGIVRCCEIGGLYQTLLRHKLINFNNLSGKVVNIGTGSGADIIASKIMGANAIGIDNRSISRGYVIGAWSPVPEFTTVDYQEIDAIGYLKTNSDDSLSLITVFDAIPSVWSPELSQLAHAKLQKKGIVVLTMRDFSGESAARDLPFDFFAQQQILTLTSLSDYQSTDWFEDLLPLFPPSHELSALVSEAREQTLAQTNNRDKYIFIATK